jgi:hypothetical protein
MENFGVRQKVSDLDPKNTVYIFSGREEGCVAQCGEIFSLLRKTLGKTGSGKHDSEGAWKIQDLSESLGSGSKNTVYIFCRTRRRVSCAMWLTLLPAYLEEPLGKRIQKKTVIRKLHGKFRICQKVSDPDPQKKNNINIFFRTRQKGKLRPMAKSFPL